MFKAHTILYHSTLGSRVIEKKGKFTVVVALQNSAKQLFLNRRSVWLTDDELSCGARVFSV